MRNRPVLSLVATVLSALPCLAVTHSDLIGAPDAESVRRGEAVYRSLCVMCHGDTEREGSLPTSRRFHREPFKNGMDPFSMYRTVTKGYGQMPPWPNFSAREVYDAIHYIRETQVKGRNPSQYFAVTADYLAALPKDDLGAQMIKKPELPPWRKMDYGPVMFYTLQVAPGNIAYKGIAVRLDGGAGGVALGRAWMLYEHDTMRMAAAWTGTNFIDWHSIAFDQGHQTHPSIVGENKIINADGPGVARPGDGSFGEVRLRGMDGKPYGPLPRDWMHYRGLYMQGDRAIIAYTIGATEVLETPGLIQTNGATIFTRTFNFGKSKDDLVVRIAPEHVGVQLVGAGEGVSLAVADGSRTLCVAAKATPCRVEVLIANGEAPVVSGRVAEDLQPLTRGGPQRWPGTMTLKGGVGKEDGPLAVDTIPIPNLKENPWNAWMRIGGFDFLPGGHSAAVCTWLGDVWIVDGIDGDLGKVTWRRIASGLFQPLGVKVVDGEIYVCCRDQIARLHDVNGDGETDFIESFNSDHQVTEHFHEFAMGLQTDGDGNFYYAKSGCHGKKAVVPHHGTLLRVSRDGLKTDILAGGFRAANGVCINGDGTFYVTDQEGFWHPENRINLVRPSSPPKFYGNMWGYGPPESPSDDAMEQPMCWISNEFDRSPAELIRVASPKWGPLDGRMLNLSYGMGRLYVVLTEENKGMLQGGMYQAPLADFTTGIMRGRFHPQDRQLYACGMYAWAGNKQDDGGFLRIRATGRPWHAPVAVRAEPGSFSATFSDPLDAASVKPENLELRVWGLIRSANYGSPHVNERPLKIAACRLVDGRTVSLDLPEFAATPCYSFKWKLRAADGTEIHGEFQGTMHPARVTPGTQPIR